MRMRPAFACGMTRERAAGGRGRRRANAPDHYHSYSHCCSMDCARTFPHHALSSRTHSHAWAQQQQQLHAAVYASYLTGASRRYRHMWPSHHHLHYYQLYTRPGPVSVRISKHRRLAGGLRSVLPSYLTPTLIAATRQQHPHLFEEPIPTDSKRPSRTAPGGACVCSGARACAKDCLLHLPCCVDLQRLAMETFPSTLGTTVHTTPLLLSQSLDNPITCCEPCALRPSHVPAGVAMLVACRCMQTARTLPGRCSKALAAHALPSAPKNFPPLRDDFANFCIAACPPTSWCGGWCEF